MGALLPLGLLAWHATTNQLGADPIREITLRTGKSALVLLLFSLAVTPTHILSGWNPILPLRRLLGLYAFAYVSLHLLVFVYLDYGLEWRRIQEAIFAKNFALAGFASFIILLPLALTSSRWAMRRLGRNWKRLHKGVYLAAALAIIHYFWLVKNVYTQPIIFASILACLLLLRVPPLRQRAVRWRRFWRKPPPASI